MEEHRVRGPSRFSPHLFAYLGSGLLLILVSFTLAACGAAHAKDQPASSSSLTVRLESTTTSIRATPTTSSYRQSDVRIAVMIPVYVLYKGWLYTGTGQAIAMAISTPADLSLIGSGSAAADQTGVPIPDSQYDIYAIKGIDQDKAIAVKFVGVSASGPVWSG